MRFDNLNEVIGQYLFVGNGNELRIGEVIFAGIDQNWCTIVDNADRRYGTNIQVSRLIRKVSEKNTKEEIYLSPRQFRERFSNKKLFVGERSYDVQKRLLIGGFNVGRSNDCLMTHKLPYMHITEQKFRVFRDRRKYFCTAADEITADEILRCKIVRFESFVENVISCTVINDEIQTSKRQENE